MNGIRYPNWNMLVVEWDTVSQLALTTLLNGIRYPNWNMLVVEWDTVNCLRSEDKDNSNKEINLHNQSHIIFIELLVGTFCNSTTKILNATLYKCGQAYSDLTV